MKTTKQVSEETGISRNRINQIAHRLGVGLIELGRNNFTDAEIERIKEAYQEGQRFHPNYDANDYRYKQTYVPSEAEPVLYRPGSDAKIETLAQRWANGRELWNDDDAEFSDANAGHTTGGYRTKHGDDD